MARNRFTNPANGAIYDWHTNHDEEGDSGKARNISHTAPTGLTGLIRQQGDDSPFVLHLQGKIMRRDQFQAFWAWFALSRTQTIYFTDFDGQGYEVQITSFMPKRVRNLTRAGRNPTTHHWTYSMDLEVHRFIAGDMAGSGVTP